MFIFFALFGNITHTIYQVECVYSTSNPVKMNANFYFIFSVAVFVVFFTKYKKNKENKQNYTLVEPFKILGA